MSQDNIILMIVGGVFIVIGLILAIWGKREEKSYYNNLSTRPGDTREFMEHWPSRQQPGALKMGGWIAIAIGVVTLFTGGILFLLG